MSNKLVKDQNGHNEVRRTHIVKVIDRHLPYDLLDVSMEEMYSNLNAEATEKGLLIISVVQTMNVYQDKEGMPHAVATLTAQVISREELAEQQRRAALMGGQGPRKGGFN